MLLSTNRFANNEEINYEEETNYGDINYEEETNYGEEGNYGEEENHDTKQGYIDFFNSIKNSGMIQYSDEQKAIATTLRNGYSVIVNAVAGSGKTTTIKHIAEELYDKKILAILYSKFLANETKDKIKNPNIDIRTIHSFCQVAYGTQCNNDDGLMRIIRTDKKYDYKEYDIIIIDEAQDLTPILAKIIMKVIMKVMMKVNKPMGRLVIQYLYSFY